MENGRKYCGGADITEEEKESRKLLGLPLKKPLVYYRVKKAEEPAVPVASYSVIESFHVTDPWYTVELELCSGECVRIHSGFFVEMQKPSFLKDMTE